MNVKEGEEFPDFTLEADDGRKISLSDLKGKRKIIYFYPADNTPGCTKEACGFRDHIKEIRDLGFEIYGISVDDIASHRKFKQKYNLPFTLLSDNKKELIKKLGIEALGRARRVTFIVDENNKIEKIFPKVSPDVHAEEIIKMYKGKILK